MSQKNKGDLDDFLDELNNTIQKSEDAGKQEKKNPPSILREKRRALEESSKVVEQNSETAEEVTSHAEKHIEIESVEVIDEPESRKEEDAVPASAPPHPQRSRKKKKASKREIMTAVLGIFMTFFVIVGVISTVITIVNFTSSMVNSTAEKEEFAKYLFPMVIIDVPEFESAEMLDNSQIIASAIWAFIIDDNNDKSKYPHDDLGGMTVPDADIEPYIRRLYGSELKIKHQTVDGSSFQMLYDETTKSYIIESTPRFLPYTPRVDGIERNDDVYTLRVSYVQPDVVWNLEPQHKKQVVDKVMQYTLKKENTGYSISSVKLLEVTGVEPASSEPTTSLYGEIENIEQNIVSDLPSDPTDALSSETPLEEGSASDEAVTSDTNTGE